MKKLIMLCAMLFIVGCTQERNYVPRQQPTPPQAPPAPTAADMDPILNADPDGLTNDTSKLVTGILRPNTANIQFHDNPSCTNVIAQGTSLNPGISVPLMEGLNMVYYRVQAVSGEAFCYPLFRTYDRDTQAPSTAGASYVLLTASISNIQNTAIQASNTDDAVEARYYAVAGCGSPAVGMGMTLSNVGAVMPANQLSSIYVILRDAAGNDSACVDTGLDFEHETVAPTANLTSPANPTTSHIINTNLQGTLDATSVSAGIPTLVIHEDSASCTNAVTGEVSALFSTSGVNLTVNNLATTNYYGLLTDAAGNTSCQLLLTYNHILGPLDNTTSSWTVQKTVVSKSAPENNDITFMARDVNNNPLPQSVIGSVDVDLKDLLGGPIAATDVDLNLVETPAGSGTFVGTTNLQYSYVIEIDAASITSYTPRVVETVYASDEPYCYQMGRESLSTYDALGSGTSVDPYQICHPVQLKHLADNCNSGVQDACDDHYILMNNIDLAADWLQRDTAPPAREFILANDINNPLTGSFNGNDLAITNYSYEQDTAQFIGMFGYAESFSLNNLTHTFSHMSGTATFVGGMFDELIGTINMTNMDVSGIIVADDTASVGGVVNGAFLDGGMISDNKININITGIESGGGFANLLFGSLSNVTMNKIDATVTLTQGNATDTAIVGGLVAESDLLDISNVMMSLDMNLNNGLGSPTVGGLVGYFANGTINFSYAVGDIAEVGLNGSAELGGFTGITDGGGIDSSFALVDITTPDCTQKCGKLLGDTVNPGSTFFTNLYSSNQTTISLGTGFLNQSVVETDIDTVTQPNYFTDPLNPPLDSFDFVNTWTDNSGLPDLPTLQ